MSSSNRSPITLSRQELYDRVWSVSSVQLAQEFGVSDVAIAKACKKYQVPKLPLGYWAKLAADKAPARPPLPVVVDPNLQAVTFTPAPPARSRPKPPPEPGDVEAPSNSEPSFRSQQVADLYIRLLDAPPSWAVPASLRSPQAALADTLDGLRRAVKEKRYARRGEADLVFPSSNDVRQAFLDIHVSREQFERSARLAQAILTASLKIGFVLRKGGDDYRKRYHLELFGVELKFSIRELTRRERHTPTPQELADQARYSWNKPPKWDRFAAGILRVSVLQPDSRHELCGWQDGKVRSVETMVREIVIGMLTQVDRHLVRIHEDHQRQIRAFEEAEVRRKHEERKRQEQREFDELTNQVKRWEMARRIRRYVRAAQRARMELGLPTPPDCEADKWFRWALNSADRIDPLVEVDPMPHPTGPSDIDAD